MDERTKRKTEAPVRGSQVVAKESELTSVVEHGVDGYRSRVGEIRRLYAEGEVEAALDIASTVRPTSSTFSLSAVPKVILGTRELMRLPLDHRAGFLLGHIDGMTDLRGVLDVAAMPTSEAVAILEQLLGLGAIRLLPPRAFTEAPTPTSPLTSTPSPSPP